MSAASFPSVEVLSSRAINPVTIPRENRNTSCVWVRYLGHCFTDHI